MFRGFQPSGPYRRQQSNSYSPNLHNKLIFTAISKPGLCMSISHGLTHLLLGLALLFPWRATVGCCWSSCFLRQWDAAENKLRSRCHVLRCLPNVQPVPSQSLGDLSLKNPSPKQNLGFSWKEALLSNRWLLFYKVPMCCCGSIHFEGGDPSIERLRAWAKGGWMVCSGAGS